MLADEVDFVVGVDPHPDLHGLAVVEIVTGAVVFEATLEAGLDGYARALKLVAQHAAGRRVFAVEGTGSFGAGLRRFLTGREERVLEVGRLPREPAACSHRIGRRRRGPVGNARRCRPWSPHGKEQSTPSVPGLCQLRDLLITTPEPRRGELRR
jgi:hypothetical protein